MKTTFFIYFNNRIKIIPKYSAASDISKMVSELIIGEKLWSWEQIFGFFRLTQRHFDMSCGNRFRFVGNEFIWIILCTVLHYWIMHSKSQTDLKSDKNCGHRGHCTVFFGSGGTLFEIKRSFSWRCRAWFLCDNFNFRWSSWAQYLRSQRRVLRSRPSRRRKSQSKSAWVEPTMNSQS